MEYGLKFFQDKNLHIVRLRSKCGFREEGLREKQWRNWFKRLQSLLYPLNVDEAKNGKLQYKTKLKRWLPYFVIENVIFPDTPDT